MHGGSWFSVLHGVSLSPPGDPPRSYAVTFSQIGAPYSLAPRTTSGFSLHTTNLDREPVESVNYPDLPYVRLSQERPGRPRYSALPLLHGSYTQPSSSFQGVSVLSVSLLSPETLLPKMFPTRPHNRWISLFYLLRSINRRSRCPTTSTSLT